MVASPCWTWSRFVAGTLVLFGMALVCQGQDPCAGAGPRCLEQLRRLGPCELAELFARADVGHPLVGTARGRLLYLADRNLPQVKLGVSALLWRGKAACEDGRFVNRWIGGRQAIASHYVVG